MKYQVGKMYVDPFDDNLVMVILRIEEAYDPNIDVRGTKYWYSWVDCPDEVWDAFEWEMSDGWEEINGTSDWKAI